MHPSVAMEDETFESAAGSACRCCIPTWTRMSLTCYMGCRRTRRQRGSDERPGARHRGPAVPGARVRARAPGQRDGLFPRRAAARGTGRVAGAGWRAPAPDLGGTAASSAFEPVVNDLFAGRRPHDNYLVWNVLNLESWVRARCNVEHQQWEPNDEEDIETRQPPRLSERGPSPKLKSVGHVGEVLKGGGGKLSLVSQDPGDTRKPRRPRTQVVAQSV